MTNLPDKITTPADIGAPTGTLDHGLTLVHEIGGTPRNYLHEVSVERGNVQAMRLLADGGYEQTSGWIEYHSKTAYWLYAKPYPLEVAKW